MKTGYFRLGVLLLLGVMLCIPVACGPGGSSGGDGTAAPAAGGGGAAAFNLLGKVINSVGNAISGAFVMVFSTPTSTTTGADGTFSLNVTSGPHTMLISRPGSVDTYQKVDLSGGASVTTNVLLRDSAVPTQTLTASFVPGYTLISNAVADSGGTPYTATLFLPTQASPFNDGGVSKATVDMSVEYLDLTYPFPVPMPSNANGDGLPAVPGKQVPSVLVAVKPARLTMATAAPLTLPNPDALAAGTRILWFDAQGHVWRQVGTVDASPADGTVVAITKGGVYGIFWEVPKTSSIRGTAAAGSTVFVGGTVYNVPSDGTVYINDAPIVSKGPLNVFTVSGTTGAVTQQTVQPVAGQEVQIEEPASLVIKSVTLTGGGPDVKIAANGTSTVTLTASVVDTSDKAVPNGTKVTFTTTLGTPPTATVATSDGVASFTLTSGTVSGTATIRASSGGVSSNTTVTFTPVPNSLSLSTTQATVKSDDSDKATITATVLDASKVAIEGITVSFSVVAGQISAASKVTDADGKASVDFRSGSAEKKNQTVTVEATVSGLAPRQIPIQITGTTASLSTDSTNLEIGGSDTASLTIEVKDAGLVPIFDAEVKVSVDAGASTGSASFSCPSAACTTEAGVLTGRTNVNGKLLVNVKGTGVGTVTVKVESLGVTASQVYTVGAVGQVFGITAPPQDPHSLSTGTDLTVTVAAPTQTQVRFATTLGAWNGTTDTVVLIPVVAQQATAILRSTLAGVATVQVFDEANPGTSDSLKVIISAPSSEASQIALQASPNVVAPSTGDVVNTVTIRATVKNVSNQVVGGAPVAFRITNPTGGGESLAPALLYTNSSGVVETTFSSGSLSSDAQGVVIEAAVVGTAITDTIAVVIGGTAGSLVIGRSTQITSVSGDTAYQLPMSVQVSDSNGNAVAGTQVTLSAWPKRYLKGYWIKGDPDCVLVPDGDPILNEDANRNLILDPGEDANGDGELTPPNSAAGTLPGTVTTDANGVAGFNLVYLKQQAGWIELEMKASTQVLGTETQSTSVFFLPFSVEDAASCVLPHSPYNPADQAVPADFSLSSSQSSVKSDNSDSSTITATVVDANKVPVEKVTVTFSVLAGQISAASRTTDASGQASIQFSSGTAEKRNQTVTITVSVPGMASKQIPVQITGTTAGLSTNTNNLEIGGSDTATLTIEVKDAGAAPIFDAGVNVSAGGTGSVTLSCPSAACTTQAGVLTGKTDVNGRLVVEVTGTVVGDVTVQAQTLGVTRTQAYKVGAVGQVFGIIVPAQDPYSLSTNTDLTIDVNAPGMTNVVFATTLGAWDGGTDTVVTNPVFTDPVDSKEKARGVLKSTLAGVATVQVSDADDVTTTDSMKVAISAPSSEASKISLQASAIVVAPSTGDVSNTVSIQATVKNASDQVVGGSPVAFRITNPTGGGESLSPVLVYTDSFGVASTTFSSGSLSSDAQGVTVEASVVGKVPAVAKTLSIVIGGTAGSVVIGRGTTIRSINEDTAYQLPMSVQVSDSNGNPVAGAKVSLSIWPRRYQRGTWLPGTDNCPVEYWGSGSSGSPGPALANEDVNRNLILDPGEDFNGDGELTPPNSDVGTLPASVTTDENGVAGFNLVYLKRSAAWIEAEITGSTLVIGTETQSTYKFFLPWLVGDSCFLPSSPYN